MTIAQNFASKLAVAFVAAAMIVSAFAPAAQAQSSEDLQEMINALLAQVAALQGQIGGGDAMASAASVCPYTWTRNLSSGSEGMDVMKLQQFLNADADTRVSVTGAGSAGAETQYYGPATAAAVSKFQVKYRSDILSPANLVNPTGFFGPSSIAAANAQCTAAPVVVDDSADDSSDDSMDDSSDDSDDSDNGDLRGEASMDVFDINGADDDTIEEGSEDAEIAEFDVEFEDGDAEISRIDIQVVGPVAASEPWDAFETFSLWVDGDKVAEEDADDEDEYLDEDDGTFRFSGLDLVGREDDEMNIVLAATVQGNLDANELGSWDVSAEAVRFFDADGVATTEEASSFELGDTESITLEEAGGDDELIVKTSTNDPDGTTLQVEDDSDSDWYNVFSFDLDTDDSENDITIDNIFVTVVVSSSTYAAVVDDAELVIDGVTIDDVTASTSAGTGGKEVVLDFDVDGDVDIDAGDRVEAELMLQFNSLPTGDEGITVTGSVDAANSAANSADGADDLTGSQVRGAATGDAHTLRTQGVDVTAGDMDAAVTTGDNATDDYATYVIEIEVTAFEQDVYISTSPATAVTYTLEDGASSSTVTGSQTVTLTSTGDEVASSFEVTEGSTETLTLTVTYVPGVANVAARMQLETLVFGDDSGTPTGQSWTASPDEDYRTAVVTIVD